MRPDPRRRGAFTLLEVLLATAIIAMTMAILMGSFYSVVESSRKGEAKLDSLRQGELVMDQLVRALRFAAFFEANPKKFGFIHDPAGGSPPQDSISWVTSSPAFIPPRDPLVNGLHRLILSFESAPDGGTALHAVAYPHMQDFNDPDFQEREPWLVSREVTGLSFRWYDQRKESWEDKWERENAIPQFVAVTLTLRPREEGGEEVEMTRVLQIPAGAFSHLRNRLGDADAGASGTGGTTPGGARPPGGGSPPSGGATPGGMTPGGMTPGGSPFGSGGRSSGGGERPFGSGGRTP